MDAADVHIAQGKPAVRRGRKARDLARKTARLPRPRQALHSHGRFGMKTVLARFMLVVGSISAMALALGAGVRWS